MELFPQDGRPQAYQYTVDGLESLFAHFHYHGPMPYGMRPYLLIETDIGDCEVSARVSHDPLRTVFLKINDEQKEMPVYDAIQFLFANGAKSDWVPR